MFSTGFTHGFSPMCDIARWGKTMAPERGGVKDMILAEYIYPWWTWGSSREHSSHQLPDALHPLPKDLLLEGLVSHRSYRMHQEKFLGIISEILD